MTSAISHQDLSDLIGRIYDCTLDPARWGATLDAMKTVLRCPTAQLALVDTRQARFLISKDLGMDAHMHEQANRNAPEVIQLIEGPLDNGHSMDEPLIISRFISPAYRAASPHLQSAASLGFIDFAQMILMRAPTRMSALGFGRQTSMGIFGDREIDMLRLLIPHLRRAVTISNVLDVQAIKKARMAETLDASSSASCSPMRTAASCTPTAPPRR